MTKFFEIAYRIINPAGYAAHKACMEELKNRKERAEQEIIEIRRRSDEECAQIREATERLRRRNERLKVAIASAKSPEEAVRMILEDEAREDIGHD